MENLLSTHNAFQRQGVLIIGDFDIDKRCFEERDFAVQKVTFKTAQNYLNNSRAIIVAEHPSKYKLIKKYFESLSSDVTNLGILQIILCHSEKDEREISGRWKVKDDNPLIQLFSPNKLSDIANAITKHDPGPNLTDVEIEPANLHLEPEIKLLLQRSFFDCKEIHIEPIEGGRDSKHLFKVHAWIKDSKVNCPLPLPFFAKIASEIKIKRERKNYADYTDMYISFQCRPNYRPERCISTMNYSSLIGNFVDRSISLRTSLEETHNTGIIFSLFENSLHILRMQPSVQKKTPLIGEPLNFIEEVTWIDDLLKHQDVVTKANKYGLKTDVKIMHDKLLANCPTSCLMGIIHGDLHSGNVMVRGNDAILIDFSAIRSGPLTADPIMLEISLSFNLGEKKPPNFKNWRAFIDEAYDPIHITKPLAFVEPVPNEFFWLRRAIREIRHILIGCDCSHDEIKVIFACYLLRIARLTPKERNGKKEEFEFKCHSYALVIAERIINSLSDKK